MRTLTSRVVLALSITAAILGAGCDVQVGDDGVSVRGPFASARASDEWRRTYTLPAGGRLEISNQNGDIDVEPSTGREVVVVAERRVNGGTDEEAKATLATLQMDEEVSASRVKISLQPLPDGGDQSRSRRGVSLRYHIKVPDGLVVVLGTGNGGMHLEDVKGQFEAATTNGAITAVDVTGGVKATSVNGAIRIEMDAVTADVTGAVTNGSIRIELPAGTKATVDASCVNGGVSVDDDLGLQVTERSPLRIAGTLNGGGSKVTATAVNGGIRLDAVRPGD
jgi:hypothetical protein